MEFSLLDTAFLYVVERDVRILPFNPHIDQDKQRLWELVRLLPAETSEAVGDAYRRAQHLLAAACELAELNRGPNNDGKGPYFDAGTLAERRPGFSRRTYAAALNEGFMLTR